MYCPPLSTTEKASFVVTPVPVRFNVLEFVSVGGRGLVSSGYV
jgi:hypothetical protein